MELVVIVVHALFILFCTCHQDDFEINTINKKPKCSFRIKKLTVDCTGQNLTRIPNFRKSTKTLILANNQIQDIPNGTFSSHGALEVLDLSHNSLTNLRSGSFKGLSNLLRLNLNSNKLGKNNVTLPKICFIYLPKLRHLSLKGNSFTIFPDISSIRSLQILNATFINGMTFFQQSSSLENLAYLDLSGPSSCKPKSLNKHTFSALSRLLYLDVSNIDLGSIMKGTFSQMKYLQYLDISYNTRLGFVGVENVTHDLPNTSIRVFKFQKIVPTFSMNQMLMIDQMKPLNETKIREIYADSNRIQLVEIGAISYLPNTIEKISIGENWLSYGSYIFELQKLSTKVINASFLAWSHDPREEDTGWCVSGENSLEIDTNFKKCVSSDHGTPVSGVTKHISPLKLDYFKTINLPRNLKELYYTSCKLQFEIPKLNFSKNVLEKVDFSSNIFYSLKGPLVNLKHLSYLDLSNNFCSNISTVFFSGSPNIKTLKLQNNLLGFILPKDKGGKIFNHLVHLETIDLSENKITAMPRLLFTSQVNIRNIHLASNLIERLHFQIEHMVNISFIDLSSNAIMFLKPEETVELDKAAEKSGNLTLDLSGNPIQCTCNNINFIKWIASTKIRLKNLKSYSCLLNNQTKTTLKHRNALLKMLEKECSTYLGLILATVSLVVLFIIVVISGLIYRYRWKLRYLYFMTKFKFNRRPNLLDLSYDYDAFVSYAEEDQHFVHESFLTNIEEGAELRVCLHKRDFLVGNEIAANITDAIHRSRKTICIITNHFLNSYWCMFEFNMARMESIYSRDGENIVYLIFLEQIPSKALPLVLLELVQSQSYVEFPNDEYGDPLFWENLKKVMSD
ncbi:toll-like receptor 4 [Mytilus trossulus]|uniref:toll-like receptor 4 n=1 Tax=Mytilus trossulus TaxID=6551 RepID=UPI003005D0E0